MTTQHQTIDNPYKDWDESDWDDSNRDLGDNGVIDYSYDYDDPDEKYGVYDDYGDEAVFEKTNKQKGLAKFK